MGTKRLWRHTALVCKYIHCILSERVDISFISSDKLLHHPSFLFPISSELSVSILQCKPRFLFCVRIQFHQIIHIMLGEPVLPGARQVWLLSFGIKTNYYSMASSL